MGDTGFEKTVISSGKTAIDDKGAAECAAIRTETDERLIHLQSTWPDLSEEMRAEIYDAFVRYLNTANRR